MIDYKIADNLHDVPENSLLESILFLMTPEQKEYFLNSPASKGVIYANKAPSFDAPLSVLLSTTAYNRLQNIVNEKISGRNNSTNQNTNDEPIYTDILKDSLEAGVRLSGPPVNWHGSSDQDEDIPVRIESSLFFMPCRLKVKEGNKALLIATHIGEIEADNKDCWESVDLYDDLSINDESVETDILDVDKISQQAQDDSPKPFFPHVKTTWHVHKPFSDNLHYLELNTIEKLIWEISSNRRLSGVHSSRQQHLKELIDVVRLSQMAMQYRYRVNSAIETPEETYRYKLTVEDSQQDAVNINCAYVYEEEEPDNIDSEGSRHRIERLLKCRFRRPAIIENQGYEDGCYLFDIVKGYEIPPAGFIADVGLESKIKKEIDAIKCLSSRNCLISLLKLGTLLGEIKTDKLEPFQLENASYELFDPLLCGNQKEAVIKAISSPDICLIQGPPGTGKTRVISEIIKQAVKKDWKTLLVAPTHVAVDNVLEKIGPEDDISAVRCVNKDRLEELDEHIQRFTYDRRKEFIVDHSQRNVQKDIERLEREELRLKTIIRILHDLCSCHTIAAELTDKKERLQRILLSTRETVRQQFSEELKNNDNKINQANNALTRSQMLFEDSVRELEILLKHARRFKSGTYIGDELNRIERALLKAANAHGKDLRKLQGTLKQIQQNIQQAVQDIRLGEIKLQKTTGILSTIDKGYIPDVIHNAILEAVNSTALKYDNEIADKTNILNDLQNKLQESRQAVSLLEEQSEQLRQKQDILSRNQLKAWWRRPFDAIWWQSVFKDYDLAISEVDSRWQNALEIIRSLHLKIYEATAKLEKIKAEKKEAVQSTEKSEFTKQCHFHKTLHHTQTNELTLLHTQLEENRSQIPILNRNITVEKSKLHQILSAAEESVKKEMRRELALKLKNARHTITACEQALIVSRGACLEAHIEAIKLDRQIINTVDKEIDLLKLRIETVNSNIEINREQIKSLKKRAENLLQKTSPEDVDAIQKIIYQTNSELERNEELLAFSRRWLEYLLRDSGLLSRHLAKYINLVCATTVGIASDDYFGDNGPLEQKQFDLLIVDEAGKVTEPEFLVAATRARRWVIVGDHKQLPPYYDRKLNKIFKAVNKLRNDKDLPKLNPRNLKISYFENLWNQLYLETDQSEKAQSRFVQLDVQRRMHPDLALFISDMFYDKQYTSPDEPEFINKKTLKLSRFDHAVTLIEVRPDKKQKQFEWNLSRPYAKRKLKLPQQTGYANLKEAKKVIEVLRSLLMEDAIYAEQRELNEENDSSAVIGIMAFYAGQVELIRRQIRENKTLEARELSGNGQFICKGSITVIVNSVDSFQGKECTVIILSFTRSNPYHNIGFVDDANRLNVAMSRARKKLILVGDTDTFTRRARADDGEIKGSDSRSIEAEHLFFEKLIEHIEGKGEIKKVFQLLEDTE
jgi:superfamily I DNA and/or RNA helicase